MIVQVTYWGSQVFPTTYFQVSGCLPKSPKILTQFYVVPDVQKAQKLAQVSFCLRKIKRLKLAQVLRFLHLFVLYFVLTMNVSYGDSSGCVTGE